MPRKRVLPCFRSVFERGHHLIQHLPGAECLAAAVRGDRVVQVEDIDAVHAEPLEAALQRGGTAAPMRPNSDRGHPHLGPDDGIGRLQVGQGAAEVLLQLAVAVLHRGVEVVHPHVQCAADRPLLVRRRAAHHQSAHRAAAEAQQRDLHAGPPECAHFHLFLLPLRVARIIGPWRRRKQDRLKMAFHGPFPYPPAWRSPHRERCNVVVGEDAAQWDSLCDVVSSSHRRRDS